ncbi:MAG: hypothetical protein LBR28_01335, partial [Bacteroidales bacterium]|nr:hypothetical protein [Bacteroidales bacterium]
ILVSIPPTKIFAIKTFVFGLKKVFENEFKYLKVKFKVFNFGLKHLKAKFKTFFRPKTKVAVVETKVFNSLKMITLTETMVG